MARVHSREAKRRAGLPQDTVGGIAGTSRSPHDGVLGEPEGETLLGVGEADGAAVP